MILDDMITAELATIDAPRKGYGGGWWMLGTKHTSRRKADEHRLSVATQRATIAQSETAAAERLHAAYAERGMSPATTSVLLPGDVYSVPAIRAPFRYHEYTVASVEDLGNGAFVVRHVRRNPKDSDEQTCLLHTSDTDLFRRPCGS